MISHFPIGRPFDGAAAAPGNGNMVALLAAGRATVDQAFRVALGNGGVNEGAPGLRPHCHPNDYGTDFRNTEGNKLCICCHQSE